MSRFFIERPNFAWVVAIFICFAGLLAIPRLSVEKYPEVAPPQVSIAASYAGASAKVVDETVTSIIEQELNGARNLLYFQSNSSNGSAEITATFKPGTDPNLAQVDVQNRLKNAESRLPPTVTRSGIQVEQASASFLMIYTLTYRDGVQSQDVVKLNELAARSVNDEIRRIPGVGRVQFFGADSAMRVWINPLKLAGFGLSIQDVNSAITAQNIQVPAGSFGDSPAEPSQELTANLLVQGTMSSPEEFGRIILRAKQDGSIVRLSDVARLETGLQDYRFATESNGKVSASAAVQLAPGANAVATVASVRNRLAEISKTFPADVTYSVGLDSSKFVNVAIKKVLMTLAEAIVLVFLVMLLFLQNIRYTIIPTIVVPVCLLGTLAVMGILGFSVNMMTMFGLVLAIGILVDDAIVVVENVERLMVEEALSPKDASIKAMKQVGGAIVAITLVLSAVFLPLAFMQGSVGVIYKQFSVALAVSILFSGFLALTMTPALCATLLKPVEAGHHTEKKGFFGWFNRSFGRATDAYDATNRRLMRRSGRLMLLYASLLGLLAVMYLRLPESFVPPEDEGYMMLDIQLPPAASESRTRKVAAQAIEYFATRPNIEEVTVIFGFSSSGSGANAAMAFPTLKDWSERGRKETTATEVAAANAFFAGIKDGTVLAMSPPPVDGLGNSGGFSMRIQDRAGVGREGLTTAVTQLLDRAGKSSKIAYAAIEGIPDAPQLRLEIDREKAEALGVSFDNATNVLSSAYGSAMINEFVNKGRMQRVVVQGDTQYRMSPDSLKDLYVTNREGKQVPLTSFTDTSWEVGPVQISRYNGYPSFAITGDAAPGSSSGQALAEMERIASQLPEGIGYEWTGLSFQEKLAGSQAPALLSIALVIVFLLLVALYESWSVPLAVMLIVPIGAIGSVAAVSLAGMSNDVYFKVGLITIIGLATKNAILIVEFARELHSEGSSVLEAALRAAKLRFRPIVMTSLAFILGVVPLTIASGAGAASQNAIGTGVIGGMLAATVLGVLFIPIFYDWVMSTFSKDRTGGSSADADLPQKKT